MPGPPRLPASTPSPYPLSYYQRGARKGQLRICKLCPFPAVPTTVCTAVLCYHHFHARRRTYQAGLWQRHPRRLTACIAALNYNGRGCPISQRDPDGRFRLRQWRRVMVGAQRYWRNVLMNHPEKLPPGFSPSMLTSSPNLTRE